MPDSVLLPTAQPSIGGLFYACYVLCISSGRPPSKKVQRIVADKTHTQRVQANDVRGPNRWKGCSKRRCQARQEPARKPGASTGGPVAAMGSGGGLLSGLAFSRGWRAGRAGLGFLLFTAQRTPGASVSRKFWPHVLHWHATPQARQQRPLPA